MADQSYQSRLDRLGAVREGDPPGRTKIPTPEPVGQDEQGWFRWTVFLPSIVWGLLAHVTVLFANMHYEAAKAEYEAVQLMFYIVLCSAAFGLLSYLIVVLLLFRALAGRPTTYSIVLGFFIGVAVISLM